MRWFLRLLSLMAIPVCSFAQDGGGDAGGSGGESGGEAGSGDSGAGNGGDAGAAGGEGSDASGGDQGSKQDGEQGGSAEPDYSTPEGFLDFARQNGAFEKAEDYSIPTELEGVEIPEHIAASWDVTGDANLFAGMAAKYGLTQHQAGGIFTDYMKSALEMTKTAEQQDLEFQKPEVILKEVYGDKAQEALPMLDRGLKALGIDASKGLRVTHAMKAIAELGRLSGEDGSFHNAGTGGGADEEMSTEDWLKAAMN